MVSLQLPALETDAGTTAILFDEPRRLAAKGEGSRLLETGEASLKASETVIGARLASWLVRKKRLDDRPSKPVISKELESRFAPRRYKLSQLRSAGDGSGFRHSPAPCC
jgi:hypothetical protein